MRDHLTGHAHSQTSANLMRYLAPGNRQAISRLALCELFGARGSLPMGSRNDR
jgi:hypothetical protein